MADCTCKHVKATGGQFQNLKLCVQIGKQMGLTDLQIAGAMATMIQESNAVNIGYGDAAGPDSCGLFQQRPSCGWGTRAQCTTPSYAIKRFMTPYKVQCSKTGDVILASYHVQKCAASAARAPAQWLSESQRNVQILSGSSDIGTVPTSTSSTRVKPYEFSRGNAGQKETSWDCMGRLADEVAWNRFMRAGVLWYVSENWLGKQPARFAMAQGARGIVAISFDADYRREASEMNITAIANRWSVLPGDVVVVSGQGQGDGLWLVASTHRTIWNPQTDIVLKRVVKKKDEPANETETTTKVVAGQAGGDFSAGASGPKTAQALYYYCKKMSDMNIPYSKSPRSLGPNPGSADCSSSCSWALKYAGFPLPGNASYAPVSGDYEGWGDPGRGRNFTIMCNSEHIWIRFYQMGAYRFDTSPHDSGPLGPHLRSGGRDEGSFVHRHWGDL